MAVGSFFLSAAPTAQNSPELHFINSFIQSSLLRSWNFFICVGEKTGRLEIFLKINKRGYPSTYLRPKISINHITFTISCKNICFRVVQRLVQSSRSHATKQWSESSSSRHFEMAKFWIVCVHATPPWAFKVLCSLQFNLFHYVHKIALSETETILGEKM